MVATKTQKHRNAFLRSDSEEKEKQHHAAAFMLARALFLSD